MRILHFVVPIKSGYTISIAFFGGSSRSFTVPCSTPCHLSHLQEQGQVFLQLVPFTVRRLTGNAVAKPNSDPTLSLHSILTHHAASASSHLKTWTKSKVEEYTNHKVNLKPLHTCNTNSTWKWMYQRLKKSMWTASKSLFCCSHHGLTFAFQPKVGL